MKRHTKESFCEILLVEAELSHSFFCAFGPVAPSPNEGWQRGRSHWTQERAGRRNKAALSGSPPPADGRASWNVLPWRMQWSVVPPQQIKAEVRPRQVMVEEVTSSVNGRKEKCHKAPFLLWGSWAANQWHDAQTDVWSPHYCGSSPSKCIRNSRKDFWAAFYTDLSWSLQEMQRFPEDPAASWWHDRTLWSWGPSTPSDCAKDSPAEAQAQKKLRSTGTRFPTMILRRNFSGFVYLGLLLWVCFWR